jgi:protocatechuate 3,4-dioxygenase beta subunit
MIVSLPAVLVLLLLGVAQQVIAPERDVLPGTGGAVITGRVTDRGSGRSLPRIVVTLARPNSSTLLETFTDEEGRYRFTEIEPGAYELSAGVDRHRSTYLPQRYGSDAPDLAALAPSGPNLQLKPGETRAGLDFALWRALGIEGRVLDPLETGMANVSVIVKRVTERIRPSARAYSDDRGMYRAYGLAPGRYRVCAEIEQPSDVAAETTRMGTTCYPAVVDETNAGEVVLTADDATGIDVRVQQFRTYSFSLSGTVVDASGSPVTGAFVGAYMVDADGPSVSGATQRGEFVLKGLAPRRYVVRASVGETTPSDRPANRDTQVGYAFADLSAGDTGGVLVPLSKRVDVAGKVTFEGVHAEIRRAGMVVQTSPVPSRVAYSDRRSPFSLVEDDLSFKLTRVYRLPLILRMMGLPDGWVLKSVLYDGRDVTNVPTDFGVRPESAQLEIILTNRAAQPLVRVLDEQGTPASSPYVVAVPTDPSRSALPFAIVTATRAEDDLMKLGPLLPGEYFVAALSRDDGLLLFSERVRLDTIATVGTRVMLTAGDTRTLDLRIVTLPRQ